MTPAAELTPVDLEITRFDHVRGNPDAPVTLVEYGEFECVHCGRAHHTIRQALRELPDEVRFVFRHFPQDHVHPFSERSAIAAEVAGAQGRFWDMYDFLFENQHQLEYDDLIRHARELGLDGDRFAADLADPAHLSKVHIDRETGASLGVDQTPSFFINGVRYDGSYDTPSLVAAIRDAAAQLGA